MHRIDTSSATADGKFQDGNTAAGIKGTVLDAEWGNAVQEEIIGVLTLAGTEPSKLLRNQLASAIQSLIAAAVAASGGGGGGVAMTGSNLGTGQTVFAGIVGTDFRFRSLKAGSGISLSSTANDITITNTGGTGGSVSPASETVQGIVEFSTAAETALGISSALAVHPAGAVATFAKRANNLSDLASAATARANLDVWSKGEADARYAAAGSGGGTTVSNASETVAGIVELANAAETASGIDGTRAVHPAGAVATFAKRANNLSDLASAAAARGNLGLGTAATAAIGTGVNDVPTRGQADGIYAQLSGANFTGAVTGTTFGTSSERFKIDIQRVDVDSAADLFRSLAIVTYRMRKSGRRAVGVVAESLVGTDLEFCVLNDDEGKPFAVDYQSLFSLSAALVQAQAVRLDATEARLIDLERRLSVVEGV